MRKINLSNDSKLDAEVTAKLKHRVESERVLELVARGNDDKIRMNPLLKYDEAHDIIAAEIADSNNIFEVGATI